MATIPQSVVDPVASAIFDHYRAKYSAEPQRGYLGASSIGKPCNRAHWYSFRFAKKVEFSGRMYRLFQTGHLEEPRMVDDLRAIGCTVYEINPATGKQWSFTEPSTGGHFRGNCDAILTGLPQAQKTPHLCEFKTHSAKSFKILLAEGVAMAKPEHMFQMQVYMRWTQDLYGADGCKRALYLAKNKDCDDLYSERIEYDAEAAQAMIDKALSIIKATEPPQGISTDSTFYLCRFCDYHSLCFGQDVPQATCRSCAHATPELDGDARWSCAHHHADIPLEAQREGCDSHRFIPILLSRIAHPVDADDNGVTYETPTGQRFTNGVPPTGVTSKEIHAAKDKSALTIVVNDPYVQSLRDQFGAEVVA